MLFVILTYCICFLAILGHSLDEQRGQISAQFEAEILNHQRVLRDYARLEQRYQNIVEELEIVQTSPKKEFRDSGRMSEASSGTYDRHIKYLYGALCCGFNVISSQPKPQTYLITPSTPNLPRYILNPKSTSLHPHSRTNVHPLPTPITMTNRPHPTPYCNHT
jgi:hypothetical protein